MTAVIETPVRFRESQRFNAVILGAIAVLLMVASVGAGLAARSWQIVPALMIGPIGLGLFWTLITLETEVDDRELRVRLFPLPWRRVPFASIESATAVTYRPIRDYGGWGIRFAWTGMAYNARGNRGVRLELGHGKHLLVGSQREEELRAALPVS